ncbi:MAG: DUF4390 domain-containing protein [Deltaproteobacteria bacterium]|nr:DUF4390 domain-containing protein [Deltaproteobacteria bacterium]
MATAVKKKHTQRNSLITSAAAVIMTLIFLIQTPYAAQDATLSNLIVTNTSNDLLVYLNVEGAFREQTVNAIMSGVPASFSFFIKLYQKRSIWFDKAIADIEITNSIKYNNLKKVFIVERSWENGKIRTAQSLQEAQKLMSDVDGLKIIHLNKLEKGKQYQVKAKAQLSKLTLPFYLHYVFFFVSLWDFETDWYTIDFIY